MVDTYLYSYAGILARTLWWYILENRDKATTYAKSLFFLSALSYLVLLPLSDRSLMSKAFWFSRDLGFFLCTVLIGHYLSRNTMIFSAAVVGLLVMLKMVYLPALPALDPRGELLFDIKQHSQLQQIQRTLSPYRVKITRAFPDLKYPTYSKLDDFYVVDIPDSKRRKLPRIIQRLYDTGAVAAVDAELKKAGFSNRVDGVEMGLAAPGVNILSALPGNRYQENSGTSMAAPFVASVIGLMKAIQPKLTSKEAYQILKKTGKLIPDSKEKGPLIQPLKALKSM